MDSHSTYHHPFQDPKADIIICSSDNVLFRLHKTILSLSSDVFEGMFDLPQGPSEPSRIDRLPVVHVTEPGTVLDSLFRLCYPTTDPPLETIEQVLPTLEAAMKYQMQEAIQITTRSLRDLAPKAPLRVYAIACRLSLLNVIDVAARAVRDQKLQDAYVEELEQISVVAYHQLLKFCELPATQTLGGPRIYETSLTIPREALGAPRWSLKRSRSHRAAGAPAMFDPEGAGVVILTADDVRFGVSESILQLSSDRLNAMLLVIPATESPRVLRVPEHSTIILALLRLCYPIPRPRLTDICEIPVLLWTARKYKMDAATEALDDALCALADGPPNPTAEQADPLSVYFAGCRLGLPKVAAAAARRSLRRDIVETYPGTAESFGVAAVHLWRLLQYHRRCRAAVRAVLEDEQWVSEDWKKRLKGCSRKDSGDRPCWWKRYLAAIAKEPWPSSASAISEAVLQEAVYNELQKSALCQYCSKPQSLLTLFSASKYVQETMEAREKEVTLEWFHLDEAVG